MREDAGWSNPKVLSLFAVIFLCGVGFGAVAMREYLHHKFTPEIHVQNSMEAANRVGLQQMKAQLSLTPDQEKTVMRELDDYAKYYQNIEEQRADIDEQRANVAEQGRRKIFDVLNEDQKKRFNELLKRAGHR